MYEKKGQSESVYRRRRDNIMDTLLVNYVVLIHLYITLNKCLSHCSSTSIWSIYLSLIRYPIPRGSYKDFRDRGLLLTKSSIRKFYGRNQDLVDRYGISVSQMTTDMFHLS